MAIKIQSGGYAWIGLTAYIAGYDLFAVLQKKETMSMAFYNAMKHPVRRWPVILAWGYITGHLFKFWPEQFDPLRRLTVTTPSKGRGGYDELPHSAPAT